MADPIQDASAKLAVKLKNLAEKYGISEKQLNLSPEDLSDAKMDATNKAIIALYQVAKTMSQITVNPLRALSTYAGIQDLPKYGKILDDNLGIPPRIKDEQSLEVAELMQEGLASLQSDGCKKQMTGVIASTVFGIINVFTGGRPYTGKDAISDIESFEQRTASKIDAYKIEKLEESIKELEQFMENTLKDHVERKVDLDPEEIKDCQDALDERKSALANLMKRTGKGDRSDFLQSRLDDASEQLTSIQKGINEVNPNFDHKVTAKTEKVASPAATTTATVSPAGPPPMRR